MAKGGASGAVVAGTWLARAAAGSCALLLAASLGGCALSTPSLAEVQRDTVEPRVSTPDIAEEGVLTVALNTSDAPQVMSGGEDDDFTGYYVDVAHALAHRLGLRLKIVSASGAFNALDDGKADLYVGASSSDASDDIEVAGSVGEDAPAVFGKAAQDAAPGETLSVSAEDLSAATIGVQDSSASQDALERAGITAEQKTYGNVNECFDALASGEVQYVACDATAGSYLARAYEGVSFAGVVGSVSSYGLAVNAGSGLASTLSDVLDEFESDGTFDALHAAWYGRLPLELADFTLDGASVDAGKGDVAGEGADAEAPVSDGINSLGR